MTVTAVRPQQAADGDPALDHATLDDLYTVAARWSPRPTVRVDRHRAHSFERTRPLPARPHPSARPTVPWALHLYDASGQLRVLAVDFDITADDAADPAADAADLCARLRNIGCGYLLCQSGGGANLHVWVRLHTGLNGREAAQLRQWLQQYRSADPAALANPKTGCMRFPGAPHRAGGHSTITEIGVPNNADATAVIAGDVGAHPHIVDRLAATAPTSLGFGGYTVTDRAAIATAISDAARNLHRTIDNARNPTTTAPTPRPPRTASRHTEVASHRPRRGDTGSASPQPAHPAATPHTIATSTRTPRAADHNRPAGDRVAALVAALPAATRAALNACHTYLDTATDASTRQFGVLVQLAHAAWRPSDVWALAETRRPTAFTHSASRRVGNRRRPRTDSDFRNHLLRQYERAHNKRPHRLHTPAEHADIGDVTTVIHRILTAANNDPSLAWNTTGNTRRRVLEALCARAAAANTITFHAGTRDIAADAGLHSPQTAATMIHQLVRAGFLTITCPASGRRAHQYTLTSPQHATKQHGQAPSWTQGEPAPHRASLHTQLTSHTRHFRHDIWSAPPLGVHGALIAWHLQHSQLTATAALAHATGLPTAVVEQKLSALRACGLLDAHGHPQLEPENFRDAAVRTGTSGIWTARQHKWHLERLRWQWWCAEHDFRTASRATKQATARGNELATWGRYPTKPGSSDPDHHAAYRHINALIPQPARTAQ